MNSLKKEAWKCLASSLTTAFFVFPPFYFLNDLIPKPTNIVLEKLIIPTVLVIAWTIGTSHWFLQKKQMLSQLDERERLIYNNAKNISDTIFASLCMAGLWLAFVLYDLKTPVPLIIPALVGFAFWSIAIFVRALIMLIQLKPGQKDE